MKNLLFAPLALAALLFSTAAADAAPRPPHHLNARERARWEAEHRPAPHPVYQRPEPPRPLPAHRVARPLPAPAPHYDPRHR